jgi:4-hydroxy-4-methyl-2-oxoglutarate aldolase
MNPNPRSPRILEQLRRLSTCVVASAIETFNVRLRNTGFADASVHCIFPEFSPMVGYAATARIRSADPPMEGHSYYDRADWWEYIQSIPAPRVIVLQDMDTPPGLGAFVGEVQGSILQALGCIGLVTNGSVRDIPELRAAEFRLFANAVSVSHAYAHVSDFGTTVEVGGLQVRPGDLVHGDLHGVQTVPGEIADAVPAAAQKILQTRKGLTDLCRSGHFSLDKLLQSIRGGER